MRLILKEDVANLGRAGEIVTVKDGYGRNYLIPKQLAIPANEGNLKQIEHARRLVDSHRKRVAASSAALKEAIEAVTVEIAKLVGEEDKLYGSVTNSEIADFLADKGVTVDRRLIVLDAPIKSLGEHEVKVKLKESEPATIVVKVVAQEG